MLSSTIIESVNIIVTCYLLCITIHQGWLVCACSFSVCAGFHLGVGKGGGGAKGGTCPPLDPECPPLDFDFILLHSLVVDAAPPYISNTLVCPPPLDKMSG